MLFTFSLLAILALYCECKKSDSNVFYVSLKGGMKKIYSKILNLSDYRSYKVAEGKQYKLQAKSYRDRHRYHEADMLDKKAEKLEKKMRKYKNEKNRVDYQQEDAEVSFSNTVEYCDMSRAKGHFTLYNLDEAKRRNRNLKSQSSVVYLSCSEAKSNDLRFLNKIIKIVCAEIYENKAKCIPKDSSRYMILPKQACSDMKFFKDIEIRVSLQKLSDDDSRLLEQHRVQNAKYLAKIIAIFILIGYSARQLKNLADQCSSFDD